MNCRAIGVVCLLLIGSACAQKRPTVRPPLPIRIDTPLVSTLVFTPPVDYATNVTSTSVELRGAGDALSAVPQAIRALGKPVPVSGEIAVDISSLVDPLTAGFYYAVVVATGSGGSTPSAPSTVFEVAAEPPQPDTTPPAPPTNLTITLLTQTSLTLSWLASTSTDTTRYFITRNGNFATSLPGVTMTVSGLACGGLYTFAVQAIDAADNASPVALLTVTTVACAPPPPEDPPDTTGPTIAIRPVQRSGKSSNFTITMDAQDVSGIKLIDVYVDDRYIARVTAPSGPNVFTVKAIVTTAGTHLVRAVALDQRDNPTTATRTFVK